MPYISGFVSHNHLHLPIFDRNTLRRIVKYLCATIYYLVTRANAIRVWLSLYYIIVIISLLIKKYTANNYNVWYNILFFRTT